MTNEANKKKYCKCGERSLPGLFGHVALCQYHFNVRMYGKEWADKCKETDQAIQPETLGSNRVILARLAKVGPK
jgi:hypothetical protein